MASFRRLASLRHLVRGLTGVVLVAVLALGFAGPPATAASVPAASAVPSNKCATSFLPSAKSNDWGTAANWSNGVPNGDFACIPSSVPFTVEHTLNLSPPQKITGLKVSNAGGVCVCRGVLEITGSRRPSSIRNLTMGNSEIAIDSGATLELKGISPNVTGGGGPAITGPGTLEIPKGSKATVETGFEGGLQVVNLGTLTTQSASMCQGAEIANWATLDFTAPGGIGGANFCPPPGGSLVNEPTGTINVSLTGAAPQTFAFASAFGFVNEGAVNIANGAEFFVGGNSNSGHIDADEGTFAVQGPYDPTAGSSLSLEIGGSRAGINYGQLVTAFPAVLRGTLDLSTAPSFVPVLGETFEIGNIGTVVGGLSGSFNVSGQCLPKLGAHAGYDVTYSSQVTATVVSAATGC